MRLLRRMVVTLDVLSNRKLMDGLRRADAQPDEDARPFEEIRREHSTSRRVILNEQIMVLRSHGLSAARIASMLGVSSSRAADAWLDPDGAKARARKKSYGGKCIDCGGATDGSNGRAKAPRRCFVCRCAFQTGRQFPREQKWTRERIIAAIQWWAETYGEPPSSVVHRFGSWNAGIIAAGFEPRPSTGVAVNHARQRPRSPKTHCKRGHEFTLENTYLPPNDSGRHCRTCARERSRAYKRRVRSLRPTGSIQ